MSNYIGKTTVQFLYEIINAYLYFDEKYKYTNCKLILKLDYVIDFDIVSEIIEDYAEKNDFVYSEIDYEHIDIPRSRFEITLYNVVEN